jgi:formyl-CoA transferase
VRAADVHFVLGATTVPTWRALCAALGLERLERDPRFADGTLRQKNKSELIPLIEEVTATRPASHWLALLRTAGVPCGEIQDYGKVFADPHLRERGFFVDLSHTRLGTVRALGTPLRLRSSPARLERAGPLLGEHTAEVLREIGHSEDEVRAFVARGTVVAA